MPNVEKINNEEKINAELTPITRLLGVAAYAMMQGYTESELHVVPRFLREGNAIALGRLRRRRGRVGRATVDQRLKPRPVPGRQLALRAAKSAFADWGEAGIGSS